MITPSKTWKWAIPLGLGFLGLLFPALCYAKSAAVREAFANPATEVAQVRNISAGDYLPWYSLPSRFLFSGTYHTRLSITELRIDHVAVNSRCIKKNRTFMISASFEQPIGNRLFSSRFELPLLSADRFAVSRLAPASVGDYVMHFSNTPLVRSALQLVLTARF